MLDKFGYFLGESGKTFECKFKEVIAGNSIFNDFAKQVSMVLPYAIKTPNNANNWTLCLKNNMLMAGTRLSVLKLKTAYEVKVSEKILVPSFSSNSQSYINISLDWVPPSNMELFFAIKFLSVDAWNNGDKIPDKAYLYAKHPTISGFWKLPLPNLYEDGRVCMGLSDVWPRNATDKDLVQILTKSMNMINESFWGGDLMPTIANSQKMFRFNAEDNYKQLAISHTSDNWTELCIDRNHNGRMSNDVMESLNEHI